MKLALLSQRSYLYTPKRLVAAAEHRGHSIRVIDPLGCYMSIAAGRPEIHYRGESLTDYDAVIPRIGASITFYGTAVVRQFEMMGVYCLNESVPISRSRDKLRCMQLLSRGGISVPVTAFAHSTRYTEDLISMVGGTPLVVKLLEGTQGIGVVLAETRKAATSVIEAFRGVKANILVQEYIREAKGTDIRCLVVGDKVVASMIRRGEEGEFRSNLHRGGSASSVRISPQEREAAVRAVKVVGLNFAGVDLLRGESGPAVIEVNSSPGLEGIEKVSGVDIAGLVVAFIEKNAAQNRQKEIGNG